MKKTLQKVCSVLTALQMLVLLIPQGFAADSTLRVLDTTAGTPAMIMLTGEPNDIVPIAVTNPFQATVEQSFQLDEEGTLQYWYDQAVVAGEYQVTTPDHQANFVVSAGLPDAQRSELDLSDYTAYVGKAVQGELSLKDAYGNVIAGRKISLESKGAANITCLRNCRTDSQGGIIFSMAAQQPGLKTLSVTDKQYGIEVFSEELGFIPQVQAPQVTNNPYAPSPYLFGYMPYGNMLNPYASAYTGFTQPQAGLTSLFDIPSNFNIQPQIPATFDSQGNNDQFYAGTTMDPQLQQLLGANLLDGIELLAQVEESTSASSVAQATGSVDSLEIVIGNDPEGEFEEAVVVPAQSALDLIVRAVDPQGNVIEDYTGEIEFELSSGGQVPTDYEFSAIDKGSALFELALVLPSGDFTLSVQDKDNPGIRGEIEMTSQFKGTPNLNNTKVTATIKSPIANSVYAKDFAVEGFTNTDNTTIVVKEGPLELARGDVDEDKNFRFLLDLSDGNHTLEIIAIYKPDGSEVTATVPIEVDKTAPVIEQVVVPDESVRAGEIFTISATAEPRSTVQVFINNRSYDLEEKRSGEFEVSAAAPLDPGAYPVHARATDELGNVSESPETGTLTVTPGLQEIGSLFGIPGIGSATLSWTAVPGATSYAITYKSIVGQSQQELTANEPRITVQDLAPNLTYVFTVVAKDATGEAVSKPTESKAIKILAAPEQPGVVENPQPTVTIPEPVEVVRPAADVQTAPVRHTKSGPEVYLLIIASLIVLNIYGKARKALVDRG